MKKSIYFAIIQLFILSLFSCSSTVSLSTQLAVGNILHYQVVQTNISAIVGENNVSTNEFYFNGESYSRMTKVDVNVTYFGEGFTGRYIINDNNRTRGYTVDSLKIILQQFTIRTSIFTKSLIDFWDRENFDDGFYLVLYPYIDPIDDSWNYLQTLGNASLNELAEYKALGHDLEGDFTFTDINNVIYFETWNTGIVNGQYDELLGYPFGLPENCSFLNRFQIAFEKTTGVLLGMHMKGWTKGEIPSGNVDLSMEYQIERVGYNLPWFKIKNNARILVGILVPVIAIGSVSIPVILVIHKRRMKNIVDIQPDKVTSNPKNSE